MDKEKKIKYSNGELTIVWQPGLCQHSGNCMGHLPQVYKPSEMPWIQIENASTDELMAQIHTCPSAALSYFKNDDKAEINEE